jgi:molybdopterin biosynthesis enzyme
VARRRGEAGGAREVVTGRPRGLNAVAVVEYAPGGTAPCRRSGSWRRGDIATSGLDISAGEVVLSGCRRLTARGIGALATLGLRGFLRRPGVVMVLTVNELAAPGSPWAWAGYTT